MVIKLNSNNDTKETLFETHVIYLLAIMILDMVHSASWALWGACFRHQALQGGRQRLTPHVGRIIEGTHLDVPRTLHLSVC